MGVHQRRDPLPEPRRQLLVQSGDDLGGGVARGEVGEQDALVLKELGPLDHLVHRHTHRVVRGGLLAVGRPDGRLNALSSAENTICLSVNQAACGDASLTSNF